MTDAAVETEMVLLVDVTWHHHVKSGRLRGQTVERTFRAAHRPKCKRLKDDEEYTHVVLRDDLPITEVDAWLACYSCLKELMPEEAHAVGRMEPDTAPLPTRTAALPGKPKTTRGINVLDRPNRYPGRCAKCNSLVAEGSGLLAEDKVDGGWKVVHREGECHERKKRRTRTKGEHR